jgi:hypothetical protein
MREMFSTRSLRCELLLLEVGSWGRGQFGNAEEEERPPLEATSKQRQWSRDYGHYYACNSEL